MQIKPKGLEKLTFSNVMVLLKGQAGQATCVYTCQHVGLAQKSKKTDGQMSLVSP